MARTDSPEIKIADEIDVDLEQILAWLHQSGAPKWMAERLYQEVGRPD